MTNCCVQVHCWALRGQAMLDFIAPGLQMPESTKLLALVEARTRLTFARCR